MSIRLSLAGATAQSAADRRALVLTSSVHVSAPLTHLRDPVERAYQYQDALGYFIRESPLERIIVCDNSGYTYPASLTSLARTHGKQLEILSFTGHQTLVARNGKGYGEGEIMAHIMEHSRLIREVDGFLKVTGRLKVVNISGVLRKIDAGVNYFMPVSLLRPRWLVPVAARPCVEVRVYYATTAFFREVLMNAYREVRDDRVFFLEHAYYRAIAAHYAGPGREPACEQGGAARISAAGRSPVRLFPTAPEITGISGSNGWTFRERSYWKKILVRAAARLGYIKPL